MINTLLAEAKTFIETAYNELNKSGEEIEKRLIQVKDAIYEKGYYEHTEEELIYGAKMAWRNSNRCIGRLFWENLHVLDKRHLNTEEAIKEALFHHIAYATNGGKIKPTITIFQQETRNSSIRIWNHQLIRYAGYETEHGVIGDSDSIAFTKECIKLGWTGEQTNYDILPLVIQVNEQKPKLYEIPNDIVLEVPIQHPDYRWFEELGLQWYAVPIISSMRLEIGGISYTAAPFNGWYMGTEIGARNLADENRYNMLPTIGEWLGLNLKRNATLWKDKALVELNIAVLDSFQKAGVTIVDHHTAAQQFKIFENKEAEKGRDITGNWAWLIPPLSPATTHIFHKRYNNEGKKPNYFNQKYPFNEKN
ncbi:nitric oxide synthase oxygenase [Niallia hominis]|uniref:Nitric oxide synthase oxygenase n=1 Tax=Niallia hominis TaxID=3133173 RepID=A0ABV1F0I5_9BACI